MIPDEKYHNGFELYFTTEKSVDEIATECGYDEGWKEAFSEFEIKCQQAHRVHIDEKESVGKAAELVGLNQSAFWAYLFKYEDLPRNYY